MQTGFQKKSIMGNPQSIFRFFLSSLSALSLSGSISAQDFTDLKSKKAFQLTGSVSTQASSRFSDWNRLDDPFGYSVNIQLNPVFYGISLPFSFNVADNRLSFSQPFSQLSFSPSYKWIQLYLGRTSMDMHPYGLTGHQFDGAGVSLAPESFPVRFSAMYGRFAKARQGDTAMLSDISRYSSSSLPAFKRTGYAFNAEYNRDGQQASLHFMHVSDRTNSLSPVFLRHVSPKANAVLAASFSFTLYKDLKLNGQAGISSYTGNLLEDKEKKNGILSGIMRPFLAQRPSTSIHTAYKIGLAFKGISLAYERISPGYETMGSYYFNQDFENLVLSIARNFPKIDIKADIGWQRDDLAKDKASRMDRIVGSAYLNYRINGMFSLSASYSNFTAYTRLKPIDLTRPDDPWVQDPDTMAFRQISQQAQFSFSFASSSETRNPQQAGIDISYQSSREKARQTFNDYIYATFHHSIRFAGDYNLQSSLNFSTGIDRTSFIPSTFNYSLGPSIALSKSLLEKTLRISGGLNYYWDMQGKQAGGSVAGLRVRGSYTLCKAHVFDIQFNGRLRFANSEPRLGKEMQIIAGYRYRFHLDEFQIKQKKENRRKKRLEKKRAGLIRHVPITPGW